MKKIIAVCMPVALAIIVSATLSIAECENKPIQVFQKPVNMDSSELMGRVSCAIDQVYVNTGFGYELALEKLTAEAQKMGADVLVVHKFSDIKSDGSLSGDIYKIRSN